MKKVSLLLMIVSILSMHIIPNAYALNDSIVKQSQENKLEAYEVSGDFPPAIEEKINEKIHEKRQELIQEFIQELKQKGSSMDLTVIERVAERNQTTFANGIEEILSYGGNSFETADEIFIGTPVQGEIDYSGNEELF